MINNKRVIIYTRSLVSLQLPQERQMYLPGAEPYPTSESLSNGIPVLLP